MDAFDALEAWEVPSEPSNAKGLGREPADWEEEAEDGEPQRLGSVSCGVEPSEECSSLA